jgi:Arc/MetJ-type ribon-helix-helix transcriptional regulator
MTYGDETMATSSKTGQLTVTLPAEVIEIVRAKVSSGEYENESAAVEAALTGLLLESASDELSDEFLRNEVVPVLEAMNGDPSRGLTVDQVRSNLAERHKSFRKAG